MTAAYQRAWALADVHRWPEAEQAVREALGTDPAAVHLLVLLSYLLRMQRDYPGALAAADAAVSAGPGRADAHAERAEGLLALIRAAEAVDAAREATRLDPADPTGHLVLARALAGCSRPEEACAAARHALTLAPRSVECLLTVAEVERDAGHRTAAEEFARAALAIDPANTYGRWLIAMLDGERFEVARSMRGLREVARDNPAHPDVISMTWPIRGLLAGLRRWLPAAVALVALLILVSRWWPPAASAARVLAVLFPAAIAVLAVRVLLPAGRLPWRCLRVLPRLMRRAVTGGLITVIVMSALLVSYTSTGVGWLAVLALAGAPVLWGCGFAELLGAQLGDPGFVFALKNIGRGFRDLGGELADWWRTTKRELRESWNDPAPDQPDGPQR